MYAFIDNGVVQSLAVFDDDNVPEGWVKAPTGAEVGKPLPEPKGK